MKSDRAPNNTAVLDVVQDEVQVGLCKAPNYTAVQDVVQVYRVEHQTIQQHKR